MLSVILQVLEKYSQVWSATTRDAMLRAERMRESLWWNIIMTGGFLSMEKLLTLPRIIYISGCRIYFSIVEFTKHALDNWPPKQNITRCSVMTENRRDRTKKYFHCGVSKPHGSHQSHGSWIRTDTPGFFPSDLFHNGPTIRFEYTSEVGFLQKEKKKKSVATPQQAIIPCEIKYWCCGILSTQNNKTRVSRRHNLWNLETWLT